MCVRCERGDTTHHMLFCYHCSSLFSLQTFFAFNRFRCEQHWNTPVIVLLSIEYSCNCWTFLIIFVELLKRRIHENTHRCLHSIPLWNCNFPFIMNLMKYMYNNSTEVLGWNSHKSQWLLHTRYSRLARQSFIQIPDISLQMTRYREWHSTNGIK